MLISDELVDIESFPRLIFSTKLFYIYTLHGFQVFKWKPDVEMPETKAISEFLEAAHIFRIFC